MQKNCVRNEKHSSLHTLFLEYETQIGQNKKLDNVFQSNCSSHAELLTNLRKIEKRPKIRHKAVMHPALQLLGVIITEDLTWNEHCDYIHKKALKRLYVLRAQKWSGVNCEDLVLVYCSLVRSVIEYASQCGRPYQLTKRIC